VPFLGQQGIGAVDGLIVSHADNDHIGGAGSLVEAYPPKIALASEPTRFGMRAADLCIAGSVWRWDGVLFEILHPYAGSRLSRNDASCVLHIQGTGGSALLPGDVEALGEARLVSSQRERLPADILVAPHHGTLTFSSQAFIDAVSPDHVVFAVGYRNRFGFPHSEVLSRYHQYGTTTFNTGGDDAIRFEVGRGSIVATRYRDLRRRVWHRQVQ